MIAAVVLLLVVWLGLSAALTVVLTRAVNARDAQVHRPTTTTDSGRPSS